MSFFATWEKRGSLPFVLFLCLFPHQTATTLKKGPFITQWFPLITHDTAQLDLPCRQLVFLTLLRSKPWRCSKLCWCPACKESVGFGKWFGHHQCTLCWRSPAVVTVWWINPVDRLTCGPRGTLRNNTGPTFVFKPKREVGFLPFLEKSRIYHAKKSSSVPNKWPKWMCATHLPMEDWTHKPDRQGLFSSHAIAKTFNKWEITGSVRVIYWIGSHNPARTSSGSMFELWISDGFEWFFVVNILYPKFAVLAGLMPVTVKFRFLFLVCGLQGDLLSHLSVLAPCFHATKTTETMNNCGVWILSNSDLEAGMPAFQLPMFTKLWRTAEKRLCDC